MVPFPCRQVRQAERFNWAATRGVNEEMLLENLPEDLQGEIRRHLFKFLEKVSFSLTHDEVYYGCCIMPHLKDLMKAKKDHGTCLG